MSEPALLAIPRPQVPIVRQARQRLLMFRVAVEEEKVAGAVVRNAGLAEELDPVLVRPLEWLPMRVA